MAIKDLPGETWAMIPAFPLYQISNHGRLKSLRFPSNPKLRALGRHKQGYWLAVFPNGRHPDGRQRAKAIHIHRLVAQAFIPNPLGLPVVNHKDGDPRNSHVSNLEWTTQKENIRMAMAIRGNWLLHSPKKTVPIIRIDPVTKAKQRFQSIADAVRTLSAEIIANGGIPKSYLTFASNIIHARDKPKISYGYYWKSAFEKNHPLKAAPRPRPGFAARAAEHNNTQPSATCPAY